jgi:hypothetical protein
LPLRASLQVRLAKQAIKLNPSRPMAHLALGKAQNLLIKEANAAAVADTEAAAAMCTPSGLLEAEKGTPNDA